METAAALRRLKTLMKKDKSSKKEQEPSRANMNEGCARKGKIKF
jgi:hypothetical protein